MIIEKATVIEYHNGIALVQCYAKSGCGSCMAKSACGTQALSALAGEKSAPRFRISVDQKLEVGDQIQLGLAEKTLLKSVFLIYALPLLVLIITAVIFSQFFANELLVLCGMLFFTGLTFKVVKIIIDKDCRHTRFSPIFLGKI